MSVPQRLTRRLQQALGVEATEDLVNLLHDAELFRSELQTFRESMRADFAEFRVVMQRELAESRASTQRELADTRATMQRELTEGLTGLSSRIDATKADLLKWSFLFWTGAVAAIAALAGVLR